MRSHSGVIAAKTPKVRGLRTIKKEVLKLIDTYVKVADDLQAVKDNMIPPLFEAVLSDYKANIDVARDAEVLNVMTTIVKRLGVSKMNLLYHRQSSTCNIRLPSTRNLFF
jgi:exportin-1